MDLIVCVGDHCHLNGSEEVVRCFQGLLAETGLEASVTLKGCFCCGQCGGPGQQDVVTIRLGGDIYHTRYQDAAGCFRETLQPRLQELLAGA